MNNIVKVTGTFEAAHRLSFDEHGSCSNIHGHSYKTHFFFIGELSKGSMVVDFRIVKKLVKEVTDKLDHCLILFKDDSLLPAIKPLMSHFRMGLRELDAEPTAESLARWLATEFVKINPGLLRDLDKLRLGAVEVSETETTMARYVLRNPKDDQDDGK